jgi:3-hydroxyacyl-CoA dehydrogenase
MNTNDLGPPAVERVCVVGSGAMGAQIAMACALAGHLGRKTGQGWYQYDTDGTKVGEA